MKRKLPVKRIIVITLFSLFVLSFVKQSMAIKRINNEIAKKNQQLEEIQEKNKKLQAELEAAQTNYDYLEKLAREKVGLIIEGEQVVIPSKPEE